MKLLHRGMTIELEDSDRRVAVIEALLFGGPLPAPLDGGGPGTRGVGVAPVSAEMRQFWDACTPLERKELVLLARRPHTIEEIETALTLAPAMVQGQHSRMARVARGFGLEPPLMVRGRGRAGRRYWVRTEHAAQIRALSEHR